MLGPMECMQTERPSVQASWWLVQKSMGNELRVGMIVGGDLYNGEIADRETGAAENSYKCPPMPSKIAKKEDECRQSEQGRENGAYLGILGEEAEQAQTISTAEHVSPRPMITTLASVAVASATLVTNPLPSLLTPTPYLD